MTRFALAALAVPALTPALQAQTTHLVVTFDRATSQADAFHLVHQLDATVRVGPQGVQFEPVTTSAGLHAPPDAESVLAMLAAVALSVDVTRTAAQLAAMGVPIDVDAYEAERSEAAYSVLGGRVLR